MYVCMYVHTRLGRYVCMYVCMHVSMCEFKIRVYVHTHTVNHPEDPSRYIQQYVSRGLHAHVYMCRHYMHTYRYNLHAYMW